MADYPSPPDAGNGADRRRSERFDTRLSAMVKNLKNGAIMDASVVEIGANGLRIVTPAPLPDGVEVHIIFQEASNNTHCQGNVVWSRPSKTGGSFDAGVDVIRWGGDLPTADFIRNAPNTRMKPDRRRPR